MPLIGYAEKTLFKNQSLKFRLLCNGRELTFAKTNDYTVTSLAILVIRLIGYVEHIQKPILYNRGF